MEGWVSVHRKIIDWEWYTDSNVFRVFFHCLLKANHEPGVWRGTDINRGQLITSVDKLSEQLELTKQNVRTALKKLKKTKEITIKTTNKYSLISITKYEDYQDNQQTNNKQSNSQKTNEQQTNNKQTTNKQQTDNKPLTTNNNENNKNNENNRYKYSQEHLNLANDVSPLVLKRFPKQSINSEYWADDIRKLVEIDKVSIDEIWLMFNWISEHQNGSFSWGDQIRTPNKLRSKDGQGTPYYELIRKQMNNDLNPPPNRGQSNGIFNTTSTDWHDSGCAIRQPSIRQINNGLHRLEASSERREPGDMGERIPPEFVASVNN